METNRNNFETCNRNNSTWQNSDTIGVNNAIIEEITRNNRGSSVTISYGVMGDFRMIHMELVVLNVNQNTIIQNQFGQPLAFRDLRKGMVVNAEFSSRMTASIPPQATAFKITVLNEDAEYVIRIDKVLRVDTDNNFLYTGNANNINSQMRFVITNATTIMDRRGNIINLCDLRRGQNVRIEHAIFQTMSIPPQTTAFSVRVL